MVPWLFIFFDLEHKDSIKSKRNKRKSDIHLGTKLIWNWTLLKTLCVNETNRCQKYMLVISRFRNSIRNQSVDEKRWSFRFSELMASSNLKFIKMTIRYICINLSEVSQTYINKWRSYRYNKIARLVQTGKKVIYLYKVISLLKTRI